MSSLTSLKQEIQFNGQLGGLLNALKSIAVQQFQSLERSLRFNPRFFEGIEAIAGVFPLETMTHPLTHTSGPAGVVAVTSDTGLLGGLHHQVVVAAIQEYHKNPGEFIVIGERGAAYAKEYGIVCKTFPHCDDQGRRQLAMQIRDYVLKRVLDGHLAAVSIVFPRALSFSLQRIECIHALPCTEWFRNSTTPRERLTKPMLLESSVPDMLEYLARLWVGYKLLDVFGMSRLAEFAARSVHLEGSSQELQHRRRKLWMHYFRARRELIDRNLRDLFAAKAIFGPTDEPDDEEWMNDAA